MPDTIVVTFEKSHLVTIGEKLYGESLELLRELVANAYDADAANVWIEVREDRLTVRDDGSGMDEEGLREFFRIGSRNKLRDPVSPRYRRPRIGQFGIGKFAVLTACELFRVFTQHEGFAAEVTFDKRAWEENEDVWHLPLTRKAWNPHRGNGTTVTLELLTKQFALPEIERFIRERLPLAMPHFSLYLNGNRILPTVIPGRRFPLHVETRYGSLTGELVLPYVVPKDPRGRGIECVVRGVVICRSTFHLDLPVLERLRGRVVADFVPITSDRSRFITDSPEYIAFAAAMEKEIRRVAREEKDLTELKERQKADETLKDTLLRLRRAIRKNPDLAPPILSPTGAIDDASEAANMPKLAPQAKQGDVDTLPAMHMALNAPGRDGNAPGAGEAAQREPAPKKVRIKSLRGRDIVARKIMVGGIGITCALEHCGRHQPAAFTEGGIVYLNMDHPLYQRQQARGREMLGYHLMVLLAQQVSLLLAEDNVRRALRIQERILTDSW